MSEKDRRGEGREEVPIEEWSVERPFDSADYLDGPGPGVMSEEEAREFRKKQKKMLEGRGKRGKPIQLGGLERHHSEPSDIRGPETLLRLAEDVCPCVSLCHLKKGATATLLPDVSKDRFYGHEDRRVGTGLRRAPRWFEGRLR